MRSSRATAAHLGAALGLALAATWTSAAGAQQEVQGFAVERFYPSAPGGGWLVMDDLSMRGGLGGAISVSSGYAHDALRVTDGVSQLTVVGDQASFDVALAVTYDRFRLYLNLDSPLVGKGDSGAIGNYRFTAPSFDVSTRPDAFADARVGFDARFFGDPKGPLRLGAGAQLYIPAGGSPCTGSGASFACDYLTDGTYRGMLRLLAAGNLGIFDYAAQAGVHIRPRNDWPEPGGPQGSELLFGVAAGPRFRVDPEGRTVVIVGPEVYGETALRSFLSTTGTGVEGLLTGRIEGTGDHGPQVQAKAGVGAGLDPHFGTPEWRCIFSVTLSDHNM